MFYCWPGHSLPPHARPGIAACPAVAAEMTWPRSTRTVPDDARIRVLRPSRRRRAQLARRLPAVRRRTRRPVEPWRRRGRVRALPADVSTGHQRRADRAWQCRRRVHAPVHRPLRPRTAPHHVQGEFAGGGARGDLRAWHRRARRPQPPPLLAGSVPPPQAVRHRDAAAAGAERRRTSDGPGPYTTTRHLPG
jgi:hypothetical protein